MLGLAACLSFTNATCGVKKFPFLFGGPTGTTTSFVGIEIDSSENIYVGGKTNSILILNGGSSTNIGYPFVAKILAGDPMNFEWSKIM